jgi:two-component system response regulator
MRRVLTMLGYEACGTVSTGEEAVRWANNENFDLIIMDVSLKGRMDGIEAARKIRLPHNVPIIFISGYLEEKLLEKARSVDFTSYLIKPIMPEDFKSAIEQTLKIKLNRSAT